MVTDEDYLTLAREIFLIAVDLQAELGTLRLAVQKHGISLEELMACREELERRKPLEQLRSRIRELGKTDLLQAFGSLGTTIQ